jgi:hypothetical protein
MSNTRKNEVPFVQISNHILYMEGLSFKAKGLFAYIQAKPDVWSFNYKRIAYETGTGEKAILSGLKELEEHALLYREKLTNGKVIYWLEPLETMEECPESLKGRQTKRQTAKTGTVIKKEFKEIKSIKKEIIKKTNKKEIEVALPNEYMKISESFFNVSKENNIEMQYLEKNPDAVQKKIDQGIQAIDKMIRIDGLTIDQIHAIIETATTHDFWKRQIRSIPKLRQKNKEGIPYWAVMVGLMKQKVEDKKNHIVDFTN